MAKSYKKRTITLTLKQDDCLDISDEKLQEKLHSILDYWEEGRNTFWTELIKHALQEAVKVAVGYAVEEQCVAEIGHNVMIPVLDENGKETTSQTNKAYQEAARRIKEMEIWSRFEFLNITVKTQTDETE